MAAEETPKYRRIAGEWRDRIRSGKSSPGSRLPSKAKMMDTYGVSLGTVNDALKVLRDEGLIDSKQGSGTFVSDPLPGETLSEYDMMMSRIDGIAAEVSQLREEVADLKQDRKS